MPDPTRLLASVDKCLSLGYEETDGLIVQARLAAKSQNELKYLRVVGTNVSTTLAHGVAGCWDPTGSPSFAARHPDPETGHLRAGKCGVTSGSTVGACFVFGGYEQRVHEHEVLVTDPNNVKWVHCKIGESLPNNAVVVDANEQTRRYHMRGTTKRQHGTGMTPTPGEAVAVNGLFTDASVPYDGGGLQCLEFDILIFSSSAK